MMDAFVTDNINTNYHIRGFGGDYNHYYDNYEQRNFNQARKRKFSQGDCIDDGLGFVKLYVAGIPRTSTQQEIHSLFEVYGRIVEIAILKEKRTGEQKECCFVKYTTMEEGDRAIGALNNQYYFPGATLPIKVRYAEGERERVGNNGNRVLKLYVNGLNKQASIMDIREVFSTYGYVEDIHIVRDEFKQSRGYGFIQFTRKDMAIAAINALNGTYVMTGCDQPLLVRFAEPKKPRFGDPGYNSKFGDSAVGSQFQEPVVRPVPYLNDSMAGNVLSNVTHPFSPKTTASSSQSPHIGGKSDSVCSSSSASEPSDSVDCDWSEHTCPDGYKYYYNCVSCESRWEKPQEYSWFEQQLQKQQRSGTRRQSQSPSTPQVPSLELQQTAPSTSELDHVQASVMPSPLVGPTCG